jgi:hypothetical protein
MEDLCYKTTISNDDGIGKNGIKTFNAHLANYFKWNPHSFFKLHCESFLKEISK